MQSWITKLQQNAVVRVLQPYFTNLNQRLIKTPKVYFEDIGLATRLQGWTEFKPLYVSPSFGHLVENLALIELCRFFTNRGEVPEIFFLRSKEKVEIDFLVKLPNNLWLAAEVKSTPADFTPQQLKLLDQLELKVVDRWVISPDTNNFSFKNCRPVSIAAVYSELGKLI